jgi:hypothetical protein
MLAEHNVLGIEIGGYLKGYAEGPLGISALVIMIVLIVKWRHDSADREMAPRPLADRRAIGRGLELSDFPGL